MDKKIYIAMAVILVAAIIFAISLNSNPPAKYVNVNVSTNIYACYSGNDNYTCPSNVSVTLLEVGDFQCPYCGSNEPIVMNILKEYAGKVRLEFLNFPLPEHQYAEKAAEAFECAVDQGKEWQMYEEMYQNQGDLTVDSLKKYALSVGLNSTLFNACLDSGAKAAVVQQQLQEGQNLGVQGTPTFFVNGLELEGYQSQSSFENAVNNALNKTNQTG
ncbi:MAG: DsbA family protein [Candidatus Marsarchaeota archaeon]|nr:DsbA family protein [Candidatus Marsarchaeota archaeon]